LNWKFRSILNNHSTDEHSGSCKLQSLPAISIELPESGVRGPTAHQLSCTIKEIGSSGVLDQEVTAVDLNAPDFFGGGRGNSQNSRSVADGSTIQIKQKQCTDTHGPVGAQNEKHLRVTPRYRN
jgi:hypothetical protein